MKISLPGANGNLYYAAVAANLAATAVGTHYSWSSPTIAKLQEPGSWLPLDSDQASWLGCLTPLGTAFGPFVGGWLINHIGRHWTIMASVFFSLIAWIVLLTASTLYQVYIGRFIGGLGGGIAFLSCPLYVAEIADPNVRGALGSLFAFFLVGGYLTAYCFGPYVSYSMLIYINFVPAVVFFLLFSLAPESPYYYLRKNKTEKALESLKWLRKSQPSDKVQLELNSIQAEVDQFRAEKARVSDLVATRGTRRGLLLSMAVLAGQQISGVNVVLFYAQTIFIKAGTTFSPSVSTIIIGVMLFAGGGTTPPLARAFGMKNMLIVSAFGMAVFQAILGGYFYCVYLGKDMSAFGWLPVTSLVGFIFTYTIGFGPLPWAVMAEMFPSNIKAMAFAICASFCWFLAFLITKFFSDISALLGTYFAFFFFALCCIGSLLFTIFFLPDTRGLTLQEILDLLDNRRSDNPNFHTEHQYDNPEMAHHNDQIKE